MDTSIKTLGMILVLTIVLGTSFNLINRFKQYSSIKLLSSDLEHMSQVMKTLKEVTGYGSWRYIKIQVPNNYSLYFNNVSEELEVHGAEEFNLKVNNDLVYSLNITEGSHEIQLYHGTIEYNELKSETVVFK